MIADERSITEKSVQSSVALIWNQPTLQFCDGMSLLVRSIVIFVCTLLL